MYDDLVRLCRGRAAEYGALRKSSMSAIALDRSADAIERLQAELAEARGALAEIADLTNRQQLPITAQIHDIAIRERT